MCAARKSRDTWTPTRQVVDNQDGLHVAERKLPSMQLHNLTTLDTFARNLRRERWVGQDIALIRGVPGAPRTCRAVDQQGDIGILQSQSDRMLSKRPTTTADARYGISTSQRPQAHAAPLKPPEVVRLNSHVTTTWPGAEPSGPRGYAGASSAPRPTSI